MKRFYILFIFILVFTLTSCKKKSYCEKNGHDFTNATCTEKSVCIECGQVAEEALGHNFISATCTEAQTCTRCGITEGEPNGHNEIIDEAIEPTCSQEGKTEGSHCSICNEIIIKQNVIPHLDHELDDWKLSVVPTTENDGKMTRKCLNCEYTEEQSINFYEVLEQLVDASKKVNIPTQITEDIDVPTSVDNISIYWKTSNANIITSSGEIKLRSATNRKVSLYATYSYLSVEYEVEYKITILGYTDEEKIQIAIDKLEMPSIATGNIEFVTSLNYKVMATYTSSNPEIISNEGKLYPQNEDKIITITVLFQLGEASMEKNYDILVKKYNPEEKLHQVTIYSKDVDISNQDGLIIEDEKIQLSNDKLEAVFVSDEYETIPFMCLVGSWAAISSENATCELQISLRVNNEWSEFITYSKWGLGLQNASYDQTKDLIKLTDDEVFVNNGYADAFKYTITLRRTSLEVDSPKLSLVSFALESSTHSHYIDTSTLPNYVNYDVPKLYQNEVPNIGNIICSATSTTMLLKYYGFDFTDKDSEYEHRYIAGLVKDYGNNIYGNWVYNTVTMGAFGLDAYVARMYSLEELMYHLANVGPVALTVKGRMQSNVTSYTTDGHLIVCTGYKIVDENLIFLCNDPNVKGVACEYTDIIIKETWRNVAYVIAK